jgi:large subunit ribosomal protein L4
MEIAVLDIKGKETGRKAQLSDCVFAIEPNEHAVYLDVKQYLATQRSGTHKSKERSDVKGSRRKLRKQKGSGAARVGDIKNPLFRGGGRVFGPRPRKYGFKLNKKVKKLARKSALSYKAKQKNIVVLEDFDFEIPKTKNFLEMLSNLDLLNKKTLLVLPELKNNILLSSRNLKKSRVVLASELNTYDVISSEKLVVLESSISKIEKNF